VAVTGTISTYPAALLYEAAFNASPNQVALPLWWTDLSVRTNPGAQDVQRGRDYELDTNNAGEWHTALENRDGALDPTNAASPFAPGVVPYRSCRIRAQFGANLLTGDQATAGDASGYLGPAPPQFNVANDSGYAVSIAASGSAYQGARVYQAAVPSGQGAGVSVLSVSSVPVVPLTGYAFSAQVRIPSGTSTATSLQIVWYDQGGNQLGTATSAAATPTSGSSTWVALGAGGTAPATALSARLRVQIDSGSTAATTTWQADGLQWEQSASVTPFQVPQTLPPNLLPRNIATGTASMAATDSAASFFAPTIGSVAQATGLTAAPTGQTTAVAWTSPVGTTSTSPLYAGVVATGAPAANGPVADCIQVTASQQYTASVYLMRAASADATVQVTVSIRWFTAAGVLAAANTGTAVTVAAGSWVRGSVTATAPAGAVWGRMRIQISSPASTTATNVIYAAAWQMEQAASASAWMDPGATHHLYLGYAEQWPQTWTMGGTYGVSSPVGQDALAAIAQYTLQAPFVEEVLAMAPNFFYTLGDAAGSTTFADAASRKLPAGTIGASPYGSGTGTVTPGSSVTASSLPSGLFLGSAGPVTTLTNPNAGSQTGSGQGVAINLSSGGVAGPPPTGPWTRMIAFRTSVVSTGSGSSTIWWTTGGPGTSAAGLYASTTAGGMEFGISNTTDDYTLVDTPVNVCDGNWHLVMFGIAADGLHFYVWVDGVAYSSPSLLGDDVHPTGIVREMLGSTFPSWGMQAATNFQGDLAFAAEFPALVTSAQVANLYGSFKTASSGESSGARAQRVLKTWIGWPGATAIDTGQTANMGPATDLTGATGLDALNAVALTESGNFFASRAGTLTFTSRTRRYNQLNPTYVFGENAQFGEWPYEDTTANFDTQHLFNWVQVTQASTGQVFSAQDAASQATNYPRILQRTINPGLATEAQDAASYLLQQYKSARLRIANLKLHPAAIPGLFAACAAMEIGTRVRWMRRPPGAPTVQFDGFVESIAWTVDPDSGDVVVNLQCSPADLASYWLLAALHTKLNAQAASGQNLATINALPDSAVNALSQSLPQQYQLVFEPGTVRQETMTLAVGGIPATNPGYSTAVLTFTTNFGFTHAAGTTVCEPLPATVTDPTTYDTASVLGAAACQVVSGGGAGTNTIAVGPLGDSKVNALGSDWSTGDLLWISPGAAAFEGYNLLTPNQSTAGEGAIPLAAGTTGAAVGITGALGSPTVTASGTAFQGANVWQVSVAGGASVPNPLMTVLKVPVTALLAYTASLYTRSATTGQNPVLNVFVRYLDANGASLGQTNGGGTTLTGSPTAAWTRLTVTATAPAGAVWAQFGVTLTTAPASAWAWQGDGLQLEQANAAGTYCTTPQVKSVAASVPGYTSVTITLNSALLSSHAAGDYVCDPLPPGDTSPAQAAGSARRAY
jgi:hypothetical protein